MQPYPRSPDLVWPGHLHGTGCLSARAVDTGFPTVVWRLCLGLGCAGAQVFAAPRHSWLGCRGVCALVCALHLYPRHSWLGCAVWVCVLGLAFWLRPASPGWGLGSCVFVCALRLYPAISGLGVRRGCVCLGSGLGCAPSLLAGVLGSVCVLVRAPLVPRHSQLVCWGVRVRAPLVPPPLLARLCGVGVCAWARVLAAPRHSWLGCWDLCVFVCVPRLVPATPGGVVCVCVWIWVLSALRFFLAWVFGRVAWCVRRVRFPSPSGGGACGVGAGVAVGGVCRPPIPFCFFFFWAAGGGGGF